MKYCKFCVSELRDEDEVCWFCHKNQYEEQEVVFDEDVIFESGEEGDFEAELEEMSTADLLLILEDQIDLYSAEEIEMIRAEISSRSSMEILDIKMKNEIDKREAEDDDEDEDDSEEEEDFDE